MIPLGCGPWRRRISRALDGREEDLPGLSAHLLACPACRDHAEVLEEDALRLERALSGVRPGWAAEAVGLPGLRPVSGWLPSWAPSALGLALGMGLLGALVLASGPFTFCLGATGVPPEAGDFWVAALLLGTLFGGALLLGVRRDLESRLAPRIPWPGVLAPATVSAAALFLAGGAYIFASYLDIVRVVWHPLL